MALAGILILISLLILAGKKFLQKTKFRPIDIADIGFIQDTNYARGLILRGHTGGTVGAVAFSSDGRKMASGDIVGRLILWDISSSSDIKFMILGDHSDMVNAVAFSPDGNKLISAAKGGKNNLILWDISNIDNIKKMTFENQSKGFWAVAFSSDGGKIITTSLEGPDSPRGTLGNRILFILWDVMTRKPVVVFDNEQVFPSSLAFSPEGNRIVSGDWWGQTSKQNLMLWDISDINNIKQIPLTGNPGDISSVAFSPDGKNIVSGGKAENSNIVVWDISDINNIKSAVLDQKHVDINRVAFSSDGTKIASADVGGTNSIVIWDAITKKKTAEFDGKQDGVWALAFSPDGKQLVSGGHSGTNNLILWTLLID